MPVEKFHQGGSRLLGILGVALCAAAVAATLSNGLGGGDAGWIAGWVLLGALSWSALVRPQVRLGEQELVLRNMLETLTVPLAAVEEVDVRRVLVVRTSQGRHVSPAVSRPLREVVKGDPGGHRDAERLPNLVEDRIRSRAADARARLGVRRGENGAAPVAVHRALAWPEIALLALSAAGLVVALVL